MDSIVGIFVFSQLIKREFPFFHGFFSSIIQVLTGFDISAPDQEYFPFYFKPAVSSGNFNLFVFSLFIPTI